MAYAGWEDLLGTNSARSTAGLETEVGIGQVDVQPEFRERVLFQQIGFARVRLGPVIALDAHGNVLERTKDVGADGTVEERTAYTYDDRNNVLTEERDIGADGTVEVRRTMTYDAHGKLLTKERDGASVAEPPDGTPEEREVHTYDERGNELELVHERIGAPTRRERWTYDSAGNKLTWTVRWEGGPKPPADTRYDYTYECRQ